MSSVIYDWGGNTIVFDTFLETNRWIIKDPASDDMSNGNPRLFVKTDIRDLIAPADNWEMKTILESLRATWKMPAARMKGTYDTRAIICWKWTMETISYVVDAQDMDFWQRPAETFERRRGDCEDMAVLLASILITSGISSYNVRVVVGSAHDTQRGDLGHAWVMYKTERGEWVPLDILTPLEQIPTAAAELTSRNFPVTRYSPRYCFNRDHVWSVGPMAEWDMSAIENINQYGDVVHASKGTGAGIDNGQGYATDAKPYKISATPAQRERVFRERINGNIRFDIDATGI